MKGAQNQNSVRLTWLKTMKHVAYPRRKGTEGGSTPGGDGGRLQELILSFEYPPMVGGIGRLASELTTMLQRRGLDVYVLTQAWGCGAVSTQEDCTRIDRVTAHRPEREIQAWNILRKHRKRSVAVSAVWYPEGFLCYLAKVRYNVVLAHGLELMPHKVWWRRPVWGLLKRQVLESASLVVANSQYTEALVRKVAPSARVTTVPLGVDVQHFSPGDKGVAKSRLGLGQQKVILTVSRISAYKGHDTVLKALSLLSPSERAQLVYLVAGTGEHREVLERLAHELGVADIVRWLGYVDECDLPDLYRAADLFVLCSREDPGQQEVEGFGLVFLEAQACGVPVIGTRTGGIPDAVKDGQGGWLITQGDAGTLAAIVRRLLTAPEEFEAAGKAARERVQCEATWDRYVDSFILQCREAGIPLG